MTDSMAQPHPGLVSLEPARWKSGLCWLSAILLALLFLISGIWKITDAQSAAVRMVQARVPEPLSLAAAIGFGIAETLAGVLVLVPRFRRWGAILTAVLLVAFMIYVGVNYTALRGEDCSCFPWVKRVVGPVFFISDAIMLLLALLAGLWSKPSESVRSAVLVLLAVSVFAFVSYGVAAVRQSGTKAPDTITVDGRPYSLRHGKVLLYFFDPECLHCIDAARRMSRLNWGDTRIVAVPIQQPQFSAEFLQDTGLKAVISSDIAILRKIFPFVSAPAGVALVNGHQKAALTQFEEKEPEATLRKLGFLY